MVSSLIIDKVTTVPRTGLTHHIARLSEAHVVRTDRTSILSWAGGMTVDLGPAVRKLAVTLRVRFVGSVASPGEGAVAVRLR